MLPSVFALPNVRAIAHTHSVAAIKLVPDLKPFLGLSKSANVKVSRNLYSLKFYFIHSIYFCSLKGPIFENVDLDGPINIPVIVHNGSDAELDSTIARNPSSTNAVFVYKHGLFVYEATWEQAIAK